MWLEIYTVWSLVELTSFKIPIKDVTKYVFCHVCGFNLELGWFHTAGLLIDSQMTCFSTFWENSKEQSRKIRLPFTLSLGGKRRSFKSLRVLKKNLMLIMLQTQTGKREKRLDPRNRGQTSNNHSNNEKKEQENLKHYNQRRTLVHPMQYSQANFSYGSVATAHRHVS